MNLKHDRRLPLVLAILALAAIAILLGLSAHGHHDECHDYCWVCHSSIGAIGLPAVSFLIIVVWSLHGRSLDIVRALHDLDANLHTAPRAPPRLSL